MQNLAHGGRKCRNRGFPLAEICGFSWASGSLAFSLLCHGITVLVCLPGVNPGLEVASKTIGKQVN
jgi:hypothetical protein